MKTKKEIVQKIKEIIKDEVYVEYSYNPPQGQEKAAETIYQEIIRDDTP